MVFSQVARLLDDFIKRFVGPDTVTIEGNATSVYIRRVAPNTDIVTAAVKDLGVMD